MKLYSKQNLTELISSMIKRDRLCRSFLLVGEKGVGKRTAAKYMAMQILCKEGSGVPCERCRDCKMILNDAHPDVITISPSGKSQNFKADDLRPIISDASIAANEGGYKIYILPCIDKALAAAQNVLLKIFEEPPEHIIFIMTAENKQGVLETILSRAVVIGIGEADRNGCICALAEKGVSESDAAKAYDLLGGNIGKCLEYLESGSDELFLRIKAIAAALANGDEYSLAKELFETDREECLKILAELSGVIADSCLIKQGAKPHKLFFLNDSKALCDKLSLRRLLDMYSAVGEAAEKIKGCSNAALTMCDLGARLKSRSI